MKSLERRMSNPCMTDMRIERPANALPAWRRAGSACLALLLAAFPVHGDEAEISQGLQRYEVKPEFTTFQPEDVPVNWAEIPATDIRLFYPGQSSWDWLISPQKAFTHPGSLVIKAGLSCRACHSSLGGALDEEALGEKLVKKGHAENDPIDGKRPVIDLQVKAAYNDEDMYFWFRWKTAEPGVYHNVMRFDGQQWAGYGGARPANDLGLYEDRLTLMLGYPQGSKGYVAADTGASYGFQSAGCFIACHDGMRTMRHDAANNKAGVRAVFPKAGDIRKYLLNTRKAAQQGSPANLAGLTDAEGRWALLKGEDELARMREKGEFLDMWMWRAARSGPIGYADDLSVFDSRRGDAGKSSWQRQRPKNLNANPPKGFMFNAATVPSTRLGGGKYAIRGGDDPLAGLKRQETLPFMTLLGDRAVPYDPNVYTPTVGDLLFQRVLRAPTQSRGDIQAYGVFSKPPGEIRGTWTVIMKRKLNTGHPDDDIVLEDGTAYPIAFAIHDDNVANRRHNVSFEYTVGLGSDADIVATKVK